MDLSILTVLLASLAAFGAGAAAMYAVRSSRSGEEARRALRRGMLTQGAICCAICAGLGGIVALGMPGWVGAGAGLAMAGAYLYVLVAPMLPVRSLDRALVELEGAGAGADKAAAIGAVRASLQILAAQPKLAAQLPFLCMAAARRIFEAGAPAAARDVLRILDGREVTTVEHQKLAYSRAVYAFYAGDLAGARAALADYDIKSKVIPEGDVLALDGHLFVREDQAPTALARVAALDSPIGYAVTAHAHAALGDEPQAEAALDKLGGSYELVLTPEGPATVLARRRAAKSAYRG